MDSMETELTIRDSIRCYIANRLYKLDTFDDYQKYLALCGVVETLDDILSNVSEELFEVRSKLNNIKG